MRFYHGFSVVVVVCALAFNCDSGGNQQAAQPPTEQEATQAPAEVPATVQEATVPAPEPSQAAEPQAIEPGTINLVEATLPTMNCTMRLPDGFSRDRETEQGAGYSLDLGNYRTLQVSLEPYGAASESEARSMGGIVSSLQVDQVTTLENGAFEVSYQVRESDGRQGVTVFTANRYAYCNGPAEFMEVLREMCRSLTPID